MLFPCAFLSYFANIGGVLSAHEFVGYYAYFISQKNVSRGLFVLTLSDAYLVAFECFFN